MIWLFMHRFGATPFVPVPPAVKGGGPALHWRENQTKKRELREILEELAEKAELPAPVTTKAVRSNSEEIAEQAVLQGRLHELKDAIDAELRTKGRAQRRKDSDMAAARVMRVALERIALEQEEEELLLMN